MHKIHKIICICWVCTFNIIIDEQNSLFILNMHVSGLYSYMFQTIEISILYLYMFYILIPIIYCNITHWFHSNIGINGILDLELLTFQSQR